MENHQKDSFCLNPINSFRSNPTANLSDQTEQQSNYFNQSNQAHYLNDRNLVYLNEINLTPINRISFEPNCVDLINNSNIYLSYDQSNQANCVNNSQNLELNSPNFTQIAYLNYYQQQNSLNNLHSGTDYFNHLAYAIPSQFSSQAITDETATNQYQRIRNLKIIKKQRRQQLIDQPMSYPSEIHSTNSSNQRLAHTLVHLNDEIPADVTNDRLNHERAANDQQVYQNNFTRLLNNQQQSPQFANDLNQPQHLDQTNAFIITNNAISKVNDKLINSIKREISLDSDGMNSTQSTNESLNLSTYDEQLTNTNYKMNKSSNLHHSDLSERLISDSIDQQQATLEPLQSAIELSKFVLSSMNQISDSTNPSYEIHNNSKATSSRTDKKPKKNPQITTTKTRTKKFNLINLKIGKFVINSTYKMFNGEPIIETLAADLKIVFTEQRIIYEFSIPGEALNCDCIEESTQKRRNPKFIDRFLFYTMILPFNIIEAINVNQDDVSLVLNTRPFLFLGGFEANIFEIQDSRSFVNGVNQDPTFGEASINAIHQFKFATSQFKRFKMSLINFTTKLLIGTSLYETENLVDYNLFEEKFKKQIKSADKYVLELRKVKWSYYMRTSDSHIQTSNINNILQETNNRQSTTSKSLGLDKNRHLKRKYVDLSLESSDNEKKQLAKRSFKTFEDLMLPPPLLHRPLNDNSSWYTNKIDNHSAIDEKSVQTSFMDNFSPLIISESKIYDSESESTANDENENSSQSSLAQREVLNAIQQNVSTSLGNQSNDQVLENHLKQSVQIKSCSCDSKCVNDKSDCFLSGSLCSELTCYCSTKCENPFFLFLLLNLDLNEIKKDACLMKNLLLIPFDRLHNYLNSEFAIPCCGKLANLSSNIPGTSFCGAKRDCQVRYRFSWCQNKFVLSDKYQHCFNCDNCEKRNKNGNCSKCNLYTDSI